jgi:NAD(P)-dependent dehydrogenase (short-subunit alcohol dehydrogenase family)
MERDLEGKVVLLTGATEGIGKAAALALARRGAALTLVGRSREKGERVVDELRRASGASRIDLVCGDLSRAADVRAVAEAFRARHDRLDVLVNNAGGIFLEHARADDGVEMTFALNHLGYFRLTTSLMELLARTPGARVVSTSSLAHRVARLRLPYAVTRLDRRAGFPAYADSKLANILFTRELARRLRGAGVATSCFHPGYVRSGFGLNNGRIASWLLRAGGSLLARTPEEGADTLVWLATSPEASRADGGYYADRRLARTTALAGDEGLAGELWRLSECLGGAT